MQTPNLLALDFDGVLCNGLIEYFQTAWAAYVEIWESQTPAPPGLADRFYRLRPVIETGWEMPVLLRSLLLGTSDEAVLNDWPTLVAEQVQADGLDKVKIAATVDGVRDRWIKRDVDHWLAQHQFYPGVIDRLRQTIAPESGQAETAIAIVTTKEGRFVHQLLQQQGIQLPPDNVLGKEVKQPKYQTLRNLRDRHPGKNPTIWFIEDRLNALKAVAQQPDLSNVRLFLADWGYNIERDRTAAVTDPAIELISLNTFTQPFDCW
jgi:phosphoglycolate phosphatase-like HAD superfamily hydrolase